MVDQEWRQPAEKLTLGPNEVHVWRAALDVSTTEVARFERTLSADERQRAALFRFSHLSQRFIVGRGILRAILSRYLAVSPETISFEYTRYGKPLLAGQEGQALLQFNVAHTDGAALYAVSLTRLVGIDIELYREVPEAKAIVMRFFSPAENRTLSSLPAAEWPRAFLRCWTRKEAYIKAQGVGLSLPLDQFSVTLAPDEPARLLQTDYNPALAERWTLRDLRLEPEYAAAVAVEGCDWQLFCWQWPG